MRVLVWALLGLLALIVLPLGALLVAGLIRRFQIARTGRALERLGFVGSVPWRETRRSWPVVGAGLVGVVALIVATLVLPGPPADRILASTEGSPTASAPAHTPVDSAATNAGSDHIASKQPPTTQGPESPPASVSTPASPTTGTRGDAGAPATVTALPRSATAIRVSWAPVTGAARYDLERSADTVNWSTVVSTDGATTGYTDDALLSGTTYYYRVAAIVAGQDVARSDVVSATTTVETPAAPVLLTATASATSVDIAWTDVDGELGYQIQRSPDGATGWSPIATTGQDVTSSTDAGLAPTTAYYYRVVALTSDGGSSAPSNVLSATTGPGGSSGGPSTSDANPDPSLAPTGP